MIRLTLAVLAAACGARDPAGPGPGAGPGPALADSVLIRVDNGTSFQTVDGFGANTMSLVFSGQDYLGPLRPAAVKAAFGDVGISLGLLNTAVVETPAGTTDLFGQRANDNADPFTLDPAGFNFAYSDALRDKIVLPAAAYGYTDVTLGPLLNLGTALSWLQPVRASDYSRYLDEAAENVLALVQHWRDVYGMTPTLLALFNEPTTGNRELQSSSVQEMVDLVARIGARLHDAGFVDVRFLVPSEETIARSTEVAQAMLADPDARQYVGAIGYHPYPVGSVYSSPRRILETSGSGTPDPATRLELERLKALGQQYGVPIWLTETSEGTPATTDYDFSAIEVVLARAIHIHDNFEYAGASAYFGMNTIWDARTHAEHFAGRNYPFRNEQSTMVLADEGAGTVAITGMGYAVGHYARWIRRGAVRIGATSSDPRVIVTAFRDPPRGRLVLVAVNNEATAQVLRVNVSGASTPGTASGEASYGTVRWGAIAPFAPSAGGEFHFDAPARSVVTLAIPIS